MPNRRSTSKQKFSPTLSLVYLPHLDYNLQRVGPGDPAAAGDVRQIDDLCGDLIAFYEARGVQVVVLSEYGLCDVTTPVHLNRVLRQHGLIAVREELGLEVLDPGASAAFAVADHQVAHVYVNDPSKLHQVRALLEKTPGVERVLDAEGKAAHRIDHARAGDLVAIAEPKAWFTYYYWLDDRRAPDFARTVDIHRKPGYDPVELLLDPAIRVPALTVGWKLAKKSLGIPDADGRDPARRHARQGFARPSGSRGGQRGAARHEPAEAPDPGRAARLGRRLSRSSLAHLGLTHAA